MITKIKALFNGWQGIGSFFPTYYYRYRRQRTRPLLKRYKIIIVEFCLPNAPHLSSKTSKTRNKAQSLYNFN